MGEHSQTTQLPLTALPPASPHVNTLSKHLRLCGPCLVCAAWFLCIRKQPWATRTQTGVGMLYLVNFMRTGRQLVSGHTTALFLLLCCSFHSYQFHKTDVFLEDKWYNVTVQSGLSGLCTWQVHATCSGGWPPSSIAYRFFSYEGGSF